MQSNVYIIVFIFFETVIQNYFFACKTLKYPHENGDDALNLKDKYFDCRLTNFVMDGSYLKKKKKTQTITFTLH